MRPEEENETRPSHLQCQYLDWSITDDHGSGDCGGRAIARSLAVWQGRDLNGEQLVSEGLRLRTVAVGHLLKNKAGVEFFFAPDLSATPEQRDGQQEPDNFFDYILVVRNADVGAWERHVLAKKIEQGRAKSPEGPPAC